MTQTDTIQSMIERGRATLAARALEREAERQAHIAETRAAWQHRQDQVRLAFPEEIRPYVFLYGAKEEEPRDGPTGTLERPKIEIPDLAPITSCVGLHGDSWAVTNPRNNGTTYSIYSIPRAEIDYDDGTVYWSFRYNEAETNSLYEAMAIAQDEYQIYLQKKAEWDRRHQPVPAVEPIYVAMEEGETDPNPLMTELVKLIRDVAREELG
jgi:predicted transcriptional regulator